jgi:hypothetical protein
MLLRFWHEGETKVRSVRSLGLGMRGPVDMQSGLTRLFTAFGLLLNVLARNGVLSAADVAEIAFDAQIGSAPSDAELLEDGAADITLMREHERALARERERAHLARGAC